MKLAPGRVVGASEHIHKYVQTYRCIADALASIFKYGFWDANTTSSSVCTNPAGTSSLLTVYLL